jgi:hypothetical protein
MVLIETGLRAGDACRLTVDCLVPDSTGWPCLRFFNAKVRAEQIVPLSNRAAEAIGAQQEEIGRTSPGSPWLFPATRANPDGARPFTYNALRQRLFRFQEAIDLRDRNGRPVRVTAHQFRHTFGTRLINSGVPQHVVQRLMGHASPQMTAVYARLHDTTLRKAFETYCRTRVNVDGERLATMHRQELDGGLEVRAREAGVRVRAVLLWRPAAVAVGKAGLDAGEMLFHPLGVCSWSVVIERQALAVNIDPCAAVGFERLS